VLPLFEKVFVSPEKKTRRDACCAVNVSISICWSNRNAL
jgi:hypothetical protein